MKFKEIKPGMVIHCPTKEDARALLEHLDRLGYVWDNFRRDRISNDTHYEVYKENTCYKISLSNKAITYGESDCESEAGYEITEFSDLIEPEPRFKVGDKVRVRSDLRVGGEYGGIHLIGGRMADCRGTSATIIEITDSDYYLLDSNSFDWPGEMLEPIDDSPMTAVEVLEWLGKHYRDEAYKEVFGYDYKFTELLRPEFSSFTVQEIVDKITTYEAAKKAPKPVEVERGKAFYMSVKNVDTGLYQDYSSFEYWQDEQAESYEAVKTTILSEIAKETHKTVRLSEYDICRVKESES